MPTEYYQFGGFLPQIQWFGSQTHVAGYHDDKVLAEAIAGNTSPLRSKGNPAAPVEIVLGLKPHGTSHLLLTTDERWKMEKALNVASKAQSYKRPLSSYDFESLSPIYFDSPEELNRKLSALKVKKAGGRGETRGDTSQANRAYSAGHYNPFRGAFEHGRVIFRVLNNLISPPKYSLDDLSWVHTLRVCSFVFNTKGVDDRLSEQKLKDPIVLDVGFCEARLPSLEADYSKAKHIKNAKNKLMGAGKPKRLFGHGTEEVADHDMPARIQEFFRGHTKLTDKPMILLVYNEELTSNYLRNMQVDTERWCRSLRDLLMPQIASRGRSNAASSTSSRRSRSRSPRGGYQSNFQRYPDTREPSSSGGSSRSRLYPPVFVLDIRQLFVKLTENDQVRDVADVARRLGLKNMDWSCAGDEAALAIDIWRSMVTGPSIDEQRAERERTHASSPQPQQSSASGPSTAPTHMPSAAMGSDDEQDPNDSAAPPQSLQTSSFAGGPIDNLDESDWGGDSDSDD